MKYVLVLVLAVFALSVGYSQSVVSVPSLPASLIKTFTNYTAASDDSSGYLAFPSSLPLDASEVGVIFVATDSIQATLTFQGLNSRLGYVIDQYVDSISTLGGGAGGWSATVRKVKVVMLKDATVNVLAGCDRFKVVTTFLNASEIGTTSGRTLKEYLFWRK